MSTDDRDGAFAIGANGLCQSRTEGWQGARANTGVTKGILVLGEE